MKVKLKSLSRIRLFETVWTIQSIEILQDTGEGGGVGGHKENEGNNAVDVFKTYQWSEVVISWSNYPLNQAVIHCQTYHQQEGKPEQGKGKTL